MINCFSSSDKILNQNFVFSKRSTSLSSCYWSAKCHSFKFSFCTNRLVCGCVATYFFCQQFSMPTSVIKTKLSIQSRDMHERIQFLFKILLSSAQLFKPAYQSAKCCPFQILFYILSLVTINPIFVCLFFSTGILYMYTFGNHYKPLAPTALCYVWNVFNEVNFFSPFFL